MGGGLRTQDIWIRAGGISKVSKLSLLKNNKNQKYLLGNLRPTKKVDFTNNYFQSASFVPFLLSSKKIPLIFIKQWKNFWQNACQGESNLYNPKKHL